MWWVKPKNYMYVANNSFLENSCFVTRLLDSKIFVIMLLKLSYFNKKIIQIDIIT